MTTAIATKPSALDALKSLGKKKPADAAQVLPAGMTDPSIVGAKRDKNVVKLGFDPDFAERAKYAAELALALKNTQSDFEISQSEMRDYGASKRGIYNDFFKAAVTTVNIPYLVDVPSDPNSNTPGRETKYVQVVCTNRYSVAQDMILGNRDKFGEHFDRLFEVTETQKLKPNALELIKNVFVEAGLEPEAADEALSQLIDTEVKVKTKAAFEAESRAVDEPALKTILEQAVTRVAPALKFPDLDEADHKK